MPDVMQLLGSIGDIIVALVLVALVAVVFFASRAGPLPKSSVPVAIGAAAAVFGLRIFKRRMFDAYRKEVEHLEKQIDERADTIAHLEASHEDARQAADAARADFVQQLGALEKAALLFHDRDRRRREELENASLDEVARRFDAVRARLAARESAGAVAAGNGGAQ